MARGAAALLRDFRALPLFSCKHRNVSTRNFQKYEKTFRFNGV